LKRKNPATAGFFIAYYFEELYNPPAIPWQDLYFFPEPHGQASLRQIFGSTRNGSDLTAVWVLP
jgi:hypothetical protein